MCRLGICLILCLWLLQDQQYCKAKTAHKFPSQHINFPLFRRYFPTLGRKSEIKVKNTYWYPYPLLYIISPTYATGTKHISTRLPCHLSLISYTNFSNNIFPTTSTVPDFFYILNYFIIYLPCKNVTQACSTNVQQHTLRAS